MRVADEDTFGARLRRLRIVEALSQDELAERAGVSRTTVLKLENNEQRQPWPSTVRKLARALKVNPSVLVVGD